MLRLVVADAGPHGMRPAGSEPGSVCGRFLLRFSWANGAAHGDALESACGFVLSLRQKLPNIICDQTTTRYYAVTGKRVRHDKITSHVRYENGRESYTDIKGSDGKFAEQMSDLEGSWSEGEFGSCLRGVIQPESKPRFTFEKRAKLRGKQALVFKFEVLRNNNATWYLQWQRSYKAWPGIKGELWIEEANFLLMRLDMRATDLDKSFPLDSASYLIDYANMRLGDDTEFVLPTGSMMKMCESHRPLCEVNELEFQNCHKFRAKSRILLPEKATK